MAEHGHEGVLTPIHGQVQEAFRLAVVHQL